MRYIDAFNHFSPSAISTRWSESPAAEGHRKRVRGHPGAVRYRVAAQVVDQFPDYTQTPVVGLPMVDRLWAGQVPEMAKIANDGLAEVCGKHPTVSSAIRRGADECAGGGGEGGRARVKNGANAVHSAPTVTAADRGKESGRSTRRSRSPASRSCCIRRAAAR